MRRIAAILISAASLVTAAAFGQAASQGGKLRLWQRLAYSLLLVALLCWAPQTAAQSNAPLPPAIASAGVTQAEWDAIRREARRQARRAGIAEAALLAAAERAGANLARSGRFDAAGLRDAIIAQLETQALAIAELQERLAVLARADDPEIAQLLTSARTAIGEGQLDDADLLLAQAEQSDLAAVAVAEARAERARARVADAITERGRLERVQGGAASASVRDAIFGYERALADMDRTLAPADWARTQLNLGIAYAILAQSGDDEARVLAISALGQAASGFEASGDTTGQAHARRLIAALQVQ